MIENEFEFRLPAIEKERNSEAEFVEDLIEVSNYVRKLVITISRLAFEKERPEIEKGILMGFMSYSYKIYDSAIFLICNNKYETGWVISRTLADVAIQLRYLILHINPEVCEKIIKSSLAYEKKRLEDTEKSLKKKGGDIYGKNIQASIQAIFEEAGYKLEDISFAKDKDWLSKLYEVAKQVDLEDLYSFVYRTSSLATHAAWSFHQTYNLIEHNGKYQPNLNYSTARPYLIEGVSRLILTMCLDYLSLFSENNFSKTAVAEILQLIKWHQCMSERHEATFCKF